MAVPMRDHHDVTRLEAQVIATVEPHRGAAFGEQVIDDHMLAFSLKVARQCAGTGGIYTPGSRKLAVVKQGSLKPNHSQYFGKHIHKIFWQTPRTPKQFIIRQQRREQERRTQRQVRGRISRDSRERTGLRRRHGYDDRIGDG